MKTNDTAKRILCYGDSNTWGRVPSRMGMERYPIDTRWPGILQELLGEKYEIIEEGLGGRTTMFDDPRPEFPERNGLKTLAMILETHLPLDLVIVMLGTTDTKEMINTSSDKITEGMDAIIKEIKEYKILTGYTSPQILIVVPPIVDEEAEFASKLFKGATKKGQELIKKYEGLAKKENILYLDVTKEIRVDKEEGVHIDSENHKKLANLIYAIVSDI